MQIILLFLYGWDDIVCNREANLYMALRRLQTIYLEKMQAQYDLKFFFIQYRENQAEPVMEEGCDIYVRGKEIFTGILEKSLLSLHHVVQNYPACQYIIRTNISSFWNIPHLFDLAATWPSERLFTGLYNFNSFVSGTGIIVSRDVAALASVLSYSPTDSDDVAFSNAIRQHVAITPFDNRKVLFLTEGEKNVVPNNAEDYLYFRVKNNGADNLMDRLKYDVDMFRELMWKLNFIRDDDHLSTSNA